MKGYLIMPDKKEKCSYTIKLRGDYLTVSRKECKSKSEFDECCLWTRKWSSDGAQYVTGFGVYDCFDLHIEVSDKMGQTVFEMDITPYDLNGKDGAFPIGFKGNCFDESEETIKGRTFYYNCDDWYSGWERRITIEIDAPFDPKKISLASSFLVYPSVDKLMLIEEEGIQYDGQPIQELATSEFDEAIGGDDEVITWTLTNGVRERVDAWEIVDDCEG